MAILSYLIFINLLFLFVGADDNMHTPLTIGTISGIHTTKCGEYGYFKVQYDHPCDDLNIQVKQRRGEPNLYVSRDPYKFPTYRSLAWSSYEWGSENLTISSWDPNFQPGIFYIGVHSYCGSDVATGHVDAEYTVLVNNICHTHPRTKNLFNDTITDTILANQYNYYRFCVPSECYKVEVHLQNCISAIDCPTSYSWPELIISPSEEKPTEKSMAWILAEVEHRSIVLDMSDENVSPGHFYVGVYGWCTPDDKCHDKSQCGPCEFARKTHFNLSVTPISICKDSTDSTVAVVPSVFVLFPQLIILLITQILLKTY